MVTMSKRVTDHGRRPRPGYGPVKRAVPVPDLATLDTPIETIDVTAPAMPVAIRRPLFVMVKPVTPAAVAHFAPAVDTPTPVEGGQRDGRWHGQHLESGPGIATVIS